MYKILTAYGDVSKNIWKIYKENNVEYTTAITTEVENKVVELLQTRGSSSIRVFNDVSYKVYVLNGGSGKYIYNEDDAFWKDNYVPELKNQNKINVIAQNNISAGDTIYAVEQMATYLKDAEIPDMVVVSTSISEDDKYLLIGSGATTETAGVYLYRINSVVSESPMLIATLYMDNNSTVWDGIIKSVDISHDMKHILVGGSFTGKMKIYSFNAATETVLYLSDIKAANGSVFPYAVNSVTFSSTDKYIASCYNGGYHAYLYGLNGDVVTYEGRFYADSGTTSLSAQSNYCAFNSDDTLMCLCGNFARYAKLYKIQNNTPVFIENLNADNASSVLNNKVNHAVFAGKKLFIGGLFTGKVKMYEIDELNNVAYIADALDGTGVALGGEVLQVDIDHDKRDLIVVGTFTSKAYQYLVSGNDIIYRGILYSDLIGTVYATNVTTANFFTNSPVVLLSAGSDKPIVAYEIDTYGWSTSDGVVTAKSGGEFQYGGSIGYSTKDIIVNDIGEVTVISDIRIEY